MRSCVRRHVVWLTARANWRVEDQATSMRRRSIELKVNLASPRARLSGGAQLSAHAVDGIITTFDSVSGSQSDKPVAAASL